MICYVDGGYNNILKIDGYGSYKIIDKDRFFITRFPLESAASSNEAEYLSLIELLGRLEKWWPLITDEIIIYSDSKLLVNQVNNRWKINALNLKKLKEFVELFKFKYKLVWVPRDIIVKELGH